MNKKRLGFVFFAILLVVVSVSITIASTFFDFNINGSNIETNYSGGETIKGVINISFDSESSDSLFTSNFDGSKSLIELLRANSGLAENVNYNCSIKGCNPSYKKESLSTFSINETNPGFVGFKITRTGEISIESLKFSIQTSSTENSCSEQIIVDVLGENETFVRNNKNSGILCESKKNYGCFNSSTPNKAFMIIGSTPFCEKMKLDFAPAYRIGAKIENSTNGVSVLKMTLSDNEDFSEECILPNQTSQFQERHCNINKTINKGEYIVCIHSESDDSNYKIYFEDVTPCGSVDGGNYDDSDYEIFAIPYQFASAGKFEINESVFSEQNPESDFAKYLNDYIAEKYEGNCSAGCFIPFKIKGINQVLTFSNPLLVYTRNNGGGIPLEELSKLEIEQSKITTSKPIILDIGYAKFKIPLSSTENKFYLRLNDEEISNWNINITPGFDFEVSPTKILIGPKTNFQILTSANVSSVSWDFGDGSTGISTGKSIIHKYKDTSANNFMLEAEVLRNDGKSSRKEFNLSVGNWNDSANNLIREYESNLNNITNDIASFLQYSFISGTLKSMINLTNLNNSLAGVKKEISNASCCTDAKYKEIITNLLATNIPSRIAVKEEGNSLPFIIGFTNLNSAYIEEISEAEATDEANLKNSISGWFEKNYLGTIDYKIISDPEENNSILTYVKLTLTKKSGADESANDAYLIIDSPKDGILFGADYFEKSVGSGTYIPISDSKSLEFIIKNSGIKADEMGIYLSPKIDKLEAVDISDVVEDKGFNWKKFFFGIGIVLVVAFIIYIALQQWYKKKYESSLFKNQNDLYNLISFVHNSRKSGMQDYEIHKKLKNNNWKGEQISYAFKKLDGKRIGMWEIPLFRLFEQKKVNREIEMRKTTQTQPSL